MNKKSYCALPAPLLWKGLFLFIPLLTIIFIVLSVLIGLRVRQNKKHHKKAVDKQVKIWLLCLTADFLSLIVYGIIGLDFNYYLLVFFSMALFVLGVFYLGEFYKLFKVACRWWYGTTALAIIFAIFFAACFTNTVRERKAFQSGVKATCLNRALF